MTSLVRRLKLRSRLLGAFGLVCALLGAMTLIAENGTTHQQDGTAQVKLLQVLTRDVMQLKFRDAEVSGWQFAYAWDVPFLGGTRATDEATPNRSGFLKASAALRTDLDGFHTDYLTDAELPVLERIKQNFETFLDVDTEVVALFRKNEAAATAQANALIVGPGYDAFHRIAEATAELVESINKRMDAAVADALEAGDDARAMMRAGFLFALLLALGLALLITKSVTGPVSRVATALRHIAARDLTPVLPTNGQDELAAMSRAFNQAVGGVRAALAHVAQRADALTGASSELSALSLQMSDNAEETSAQANVVSAAAGQVSTNVATMASAAEEMTTSISEIARNTGDAVSMAADGVATAKATSGAVARLGEASAEIGAIVNTITSIAAQTNLLALNATIEAARAGDAGKGFAVVAGEVKDLAQETARATDDITAKIGAIQKTTLDAIQAIEQISSVVGLISGIQTTIATAVEEQSATTAEIGRNVADVANDSGQIADNISGVATTAASTSQGADTTQRAAQDLAVMAVDLQQLVTAYRY